ncbi:DNA polymerase protein [Rhizobium phage RHph_N65]|nr:DNA polymerase protein [Rhizobium phage RHph_N65]
MNGLEIDFETRSDVDIKKHGVYRYMASPHTAPLMASYKINGGPKKRWRPGEPCPQDIVDHVNSGGIVSAHNNSFERLLWQMILTPRYGWPALRLEQCRCTAATAAAMSLPRALGDLGAALDLPVQKDKEGMRLIRKFSIPRKPKKDEDPNGLYWNAPEDHPEDFEKFHDYCDVDVETEAAADRRMVPLSEYEQDLWLIDQRINDRGIRIDRISAQAAIRLADKAKALLDREMRITTGGYVKKCSEPGKLVEWVQSQGVDMSSAAKAEIEELLEYDDLPANVRHAISIRQEAAKTSVAKLTAFMARASEDGRIRGAFLFCAAGTGRWSSVGAQLHNLPRPRGLFGDAHIRTDLLFQLIRREDPDLLRFMYGDELGKTLWLLSDAIRGFIWAGPGNDLVVADYSGIEGAVAAWFADETWKVQAMFDIAADPALPDLYRRAAAGIFNTTTDELTKKDPRRQVGKVSELSLQYQGGPGAFRSMARNYSMKLAPLYPIVWEAADQERRDKALKRYDNACKRKEPITTLLNREEFLAAEIVKIGWRATHPAISASWPALEDGARQAVENPGSVVRVLKVDYLVARGFLWCRLPSGRCLAYGSPRIKKQVWVKVKQDDGSWSDVSETMGVEEAEAAEKKGRVAIMRNDSGDYNYAKSTVTALGVNSVTKKWERFGLYGGLAFENIVQAIARDLLANGIKKAEAAGYPVIGHVHDEILAEVPRGFGDVGEFEKLICELPDWAAGLPLTAGGWRGKRYRKE